MIVTDYLRVAPFINDCPNCKNGLVGNGQGALNLSDNIIKRSCRCGFRFAFDVSKGTTKKLIKEAIEQALHEMGEK